MEWSGPSETEEAFPSVVGMTLQTGRVQTEDIN